MECSISSMKHISDTNINITLLASGLQTNLVSLDFLLVDALFIKLDIALEESSNLNKLLFFLQHFKS